jgi:hypothetical protein
MIYDRLLIPMPYYRPALFLKELI